MAAYLFQIELPPFNEEIASIIGPHRVHIGKLFSEGRILSYSVSTRRDFVWCVINAEEEKEAMEIVSGFPLSKFFVDISCHSLLFHNTLPATLPDISLN
jgi:hypothetical protein